MPMISGDLEIKEADCDGIHIMEKPRMNKSNNGKVYIYYTEIPRLIQVLKQFQTKDLKEQNGITYKGLKDGYMFR